MDTPVPSSVSRSAFGSPPLPVTARVEPAIEEARAPSHAAWRPTGPRLGLGEFQVSVEPPPPQGWGSNLERLREILKIGGPTAPFELGKLVERKMKITIDAFDSLLDSGVLRKDSAELKEKRAKLQDYRAIIQTNLVNALISAASKGQGESAFLDIMWLLRDYQACIVSAESIVGWSRYLQTKYQ